jgi:hypothetical protein
MKTSTDIRQIENYLLGKLRTPSKLLFEAKMLMDPALRSNVELQRRLYSIVRILGRRRIKSEVEDIHNRLFKDPNKVNFRQNLYNLFLNS